jgi:hypothetical protein
MKAEKRKSYHIVVNAFVRFYQEPFDSTTQQYKQGVVKNYSDGGMCILTEHPLPKGSVVAVELPIESETGDLVIVQVRGVVRWVRRLQERRGMGVEFFEFTKSENENFNEWMANLLIK